MTFVALAFVTFVATLGVHVPQVRAHYRLDDGTLSIALLAIAVGAVACLALLFIGIACDMVGFSANY